MHMSQTEKRLYKVLRNVGVKPNYIKAALTVDDLYLDDYDYKLLVHYFENEFQVEVKDHEVKKLIDLKQVSKFLKKKRLK